MAVRVRILPGRHDNYPWTADVDGYSMHEMKEMDRWCKETFGPEYVRWETWNIGYLFVHHKDAVMLQMVRG